MLNEREAPTLLILHGLLSAGADASEKTIDAAIAGAALLAAKLDALNEKPKREKKSKDPAETDAPKDPEPPPPA